MRVKLGYRDRLVEFSGGWLYVFDGKLYSVPIREVVSYYLNGTAVLPEGIKPIATDVVRFLMKTGELEWFSSSQAQCSETLE
ncbi:hypothetical protein [Thermococcus sp.]|uniref:hypothetical protein n=1 Tax=Thermococcus sp. TaxID=35749 RepID=UPI0026234151|nr:hypothetical protein [Thermococcus sp.]